ncbi:MAG: riboflavin synthase [bacterium]|nr:riboflavin synthase [bacterium]
MFTGIITEIGTVKKRTASGLEVAASPSIVRRLGLGESVAVNGACLTVTSARAGTIKADVMEETWRKTMLGKLISGKKVNLELPLKADSLISGHFVHGHVDGVGKVSKVVKTGASYLLTLEVPREISRHLVDKGSIAVNGISLTIIRASKNKFSVGIIPHTWRNTTLHEVKAGDTVNIEIDILAKYASKSLTAHLPASLAYSRE